MLRNLVLSLLAITFVVGCASKKKSSDENIDSSNLGGTPVVDSTPMGYDPQGSDSGTINGLKTIYFPYDKSSLDSSAKADLQGNAVRMKSNPNAKLQIEGHCDSRGTIEYNVALGERRANTVRAYLAGLGVAESRMSIISYGEEKPLVASESEEAFAKNRRANFVPVQ